MSLLDQAYEKYAHAEVPVRDVKNPVSEAKESRSTQSELQERAGPDWEEISADPAKLKAFAELVMITDMRHRGVVPDHYTATTNCKHCGPVPIFEGNWPESDGCPWCFNRLRGLPMPSKHDTTRSMK